MICLLVGITQFFMMMSYTYVTAISRDGQNAVFMKYIPVSYYKQIQYKAMPAILLNGIMIGLTLLILYAIIPNLGIITYLSVFVIAMLLNILQSQLMVVVDLKRPKLEWTTEYEYDIYFLFSFCDYRNNNHYGYFNRQFIYMDRDSYFTNSIGNGYDRRGPLYLLTSK